MNLLFGLIGAPPREREWPDTHTKHPDVWPSCGNSTISQPLFTRPSRSIQCSSRDKLVFHFMAEQPAPAPHFAHPEGYAALRIVLVTVPRVSRTCEHFPDRFDLRLLQVAGTNPAMFAIDSLLSPAFETHSLHSGLPRYFQASSGRTSVALSVGSTLRAYGIAYCRAYGLSTYGLFENPFELR